ncbi:capsular polysaccharide synthesis protein [Sphingobacterium sp. 1.A.5]|uniref:capsular polysaccharide synthesis protein n=1 Tax=Sphingobacterium sp. 1.A.5 TaxID=2044604 RepID=UPI001C5577C0|nr:capsular polysaccharide synthesis protein [Sphingobacterium sp. 1.A.5]
MIDKIKKLPLVSDIWASYRSSKIKKKHKEVASFWQPIIDDYYSGKIQKLDLKPKKELKTEKIIWQYWGQGVDQKDLPQVVNVCFKSVDYFKEDYLVIRVDDSNFSEYIDLPDYVLEKLSEGTFKRTFFSDLLRLALLTCYGGVWLDATILLTGPLNANFAEMPYFMFQRDPNETNKKRWENSYSYYWGWGKDFKVNVLNSIIYAEKGNPLIYDMFQLINYYWKTQTDIIDYFFFQVLYNELVEGKLKDQKCVIESDVNPHLLQTKFNGVEGLKSYKEVLKLTNTHKMSYFKEEGMNRFNAFVQEELQPIL